MLENYITEFANYQLAIRNNAPTTVNTYCKSLKSLVTGARLQSFEDITNQRVEQFLHDRIKNGKVPASNSDIIVALRQFLKFCKKRGYTDIDYEMFEPPRRLRSKPTYITPEEVNKLLSVINRERDRLMVLILFTSGCRVNEMLNLCVEDFKDNSFSILVKGRKPHLYYFDKGVAERLKIYLYLENISDGRIFRTTTGKPITRTVVDYCLRNATQKAGIKKRIHPHIFRHGFATQTLDNGADVRTIQVMLGHESILTTQRYLHISDKRQQEAHEKYAPNTGYSATPLPNAYPQDISNILERP